MGTVKRIVALLVLATIALLVWSGRSDRTARVDRESREPSLDRPRVAVQLVAVAPPPVDLNAADRERDLHGIVVRRSDGEPVPGARITVLREPWRRVQPRVYRLSPVKEEGPYATSATDGTFSIPLDHLGSCALRVEKVGFTTMEWSRRRRGERVRIELEEGVPLVVRITDSEKNPVEGARVFAICWHESFRGSRHEGETDATGEVSWPHTMDSVSVEFRVEHERHGYLRTNRGRAEPIVLEYPAGRTVVGRVLDARTKQPLAGARVGLGANLEGTVATDDEGRFAYRAWTGQRGGLLCAEAPGYATGGVRVALASEVEIALTPGGSIVARVVDARGVPVMGARARVESHNGVGRSFIPQTRRCVSDEDGYIRFDGIGTHPSPKYSKHKLHVFADGHARLVRELELVAKEEPHDLGDLLLAEPHALAISVMRSGKPVVRTRTWLLGPINPTANAEHTAPTEFGMTDDLGRVRFGELAPGRYRFTVRPGNAPGARPVFQLREREQHEEVELPAGRRVKITVVDEAGQPPDSYRFLRLSATHERNSVSTRVDKDGTAVLFVWPESRFIRVQDMRSQMLSKAREFALDSEASELRIVYTNKVVIQGIVVDREGRGVDHPSLRAVRSGREVGNGAGNARGEFRLWVEPGGPCHVEAYGTFVRGGGEHGRRVGWNESVAPGTRDLRIVVREEARDRTLRIRAVDPNGLSLPGVVVGLKWRMSKRTDETGLLLLAELPATSGEIQGFDPDHRFAYPPPVVVVPRAQTINLVFRHGSPVRVRIMDGSKPVASTLCRIYGDDAHLQHMTDGDGWVSFLIPDGVDETYNISLHLQRQQFNVLGVSRRSDGQSFDLRELEKR